MAPRTDIGTKADELRRILVEYNGMPSEKGNKSAYAKVRYIVKRYGEEPSIKSVLQEFNITTICKYKQNGINEIRSILMEYEGVPSSSTEKTLYQRVKKFFYDHPDDEEVEKLKYIFCFQTYPLANTKYGERPENQYDTGPRGPLFRWMGQVAYEYIEYVYSKYGVLPANNTRPMKTLLHKLDRCKYYKYDEYTQEGEFYDLYHFIIRMYNMGCKHGVIHHAYFKYTFFK